MALSSSAVGRPEALAGAQPPAEQPAPAEAGKAGQPWLWVVPAFVTLAVTLWAIRTPSYSMDETYTMSAVQRPFGALLSMLAHVDAVHGAYYAVVWPLVWLFGPGELVTRLPSAVGMSIAAAAVFGIGRRLVSTRAGLAAGLIFAVLPAVSLYGQTARPYGLAAGLAAICSYLLVRAIQAADAGNRVWGWLLAYCWCLAALGYIHLFALLLAVAHVFPVARTSLRDRASRAGKSLAAGWVIAVVAALGLISPLLPAVYAQVGASLPGANPPWTWSVLNLEGLIGTNEMAAVECVVVVCAVAVSAITRWPRLLARWPSDLLMLAVPWLVLPPAILIGASEFVHVYTFRYVVFCVPAVALLLGAAASALGWLVGTAAIAVLSVLAVPTLVAMRTPTGHDSAFRQADQIIASNIRPGDVLAYTPVTEPVEMAYPYGMRQLRNVDQALTPIAADSLGGTLAWYRVVGARVAAARRVWRVQLTYGQQHRLGNLSKEPAMLQKDGFKLVRTWRLTGIWVSLYARG